MLADNFTIEELKMEDDMKDYTLDTTILPWEILETTRFFFQKKGVDKTTILDICERLDIKKTQFHKHFESLDEVLEILWAMWNIDVRVRCANISEES